MSNPNSEVRDERRRPNGTGTLSRASTTSTKRGSTASPACSFPARRRSPRTPSPRRSSRCTEPWAEGRVDNFFGYARRTLVNHVLGTFRKQQVADRHLASVGAPERGERMVDDSVVDAQAVFEALETLPDRRRTAVVLRFYEDLPYGDIAEMMEISVGAAKAHVFAGLGQLRELMTGPAS